MQSIINNLSDTSLSEGGLYGCVVTRDLPTGQGSPTLAVRLHTISEKTVDGTLRETTVLEKHLPVGKSLRELAAYRLLSSVEPIVQGEVSHHPVVYEIKNTGDVVRIFMEYADGKELNLEDVSARRAGRALGAMSRRYGQVFPDAAPFNRGRAASPILGTDLQTVAEILKSHERREKLLSVVEDFNSSTDLIRQWQSAAERCLCHGDLKPQNLIVVNSGNKFRFYFIDWAAVSWDCIGSDIGGLFHADSFAKLEAAKESDAVERQMFRGFLSGIGRDYSRSLVQEMALAANLHFSVRFFSWAMRSRNRRLLLRSIRRARHVLKSLK